MFSKALEYDSTFALAYTGLARVFQNANYKPDSALFLCNKALSFDKQVFEAYILRGNYYRGINNVTRAIDEYDLALNINPNSWEAYYQKGLLYRLFDLVKSIDNFHIAASLNRGSELADIKYEISRVYRFAGFYDKSKDIALEVLELDSDSVRYFSHVSSAEHYLGNEEKALSLVKKAYAIDSTNVRIWSNLGESYFFMGKWEESLKYYKKYFVNGLDFDPLSLSRLGYVYLKNGYKKEAENCLDILMKLSENSINLDPQSQQSLYYYYLLAGVYAIRGDIEKAYENLKRFSQIQFATSNAVDYMNFYWFDSIRNEPEFQKIVSEIEAKYQAEHERFRKWLEENNML